MKILLILPAYNEEDTIVNTVRKIREAVFPENWDVDWLVINDGSTDRTAELCREHQIPCLSLIRNLGIGGAVQTGYLYAVRHHYDVAVQFDGDGQHDIHSLPQLVEPILEDRLDFVVGSRFISNSSAFRSTRMRRVGIRYLSFIIRLVTGERVMDVTSGNRAASRKAFEYLAHNYPVDYPEPESLVHLHNQRIRIGEVPVTMFERDGGRSSIRPWSSVYYILKVSLAILIARIQRGKGDA